MPMTERHAGRSIQGLATGLALSAVAVLVSLILLESGVRLFAPQQLVAGRPDVFLPTDSLGWILRPGLSTTINTGERRVTLLTDSAGLRVGRAGRREGGSTLLLMGDSFLAALQVEEEQSIGGLLQARLEAMLDGPVQVRNAGVPGWDPPQYLVRARQLLRAEPIALAVVFVYLGNDVVTDARPYVPALEAIPARPFRLPRSLSGAEVTDAWLRPANDGLERHSHLFLLLKDRLRPLLMRLGLTAEYFPVEFMRSEAAAPRWDLTAGLLADLAAAADAHQVRTLFVLLPTPWQMEPLVFAEYIAGFGLDSTAVDLDQPNRLLGERLRAKGLDVLDPLSTLRSIAGDGTALFGRVDRHLSPDGHRVLADLLAPAIRDRMDPNRRGHGSAVTRR
jgi:hypothetical protein